MNEIDKLYKLVIEHTTGEEKIRLMHFLKEISEKIESKKNESK